MPKGIYKRTKKRSWKLSEETKKKISVATTGKNNPAWKGGKTISSQGYVLIYSPNHPRQYNNYYLEHKLIAEKILNRILLKTEIIHHIDGNKKNNNYNNLYLFKTRNEHDRYEALKNKPVLKTNLYNPEMKTVPVTFNEKKELERLEQKEMFGEKKPEKKPYYDYNK